VSEPLDHEIRTLQSVFWSDRDPAGLAFAPLADAFLRQGDVREALDLLTDGMSRHPQYATGHVVAARLYFEQGMHSEAELAARRVLDLDSGNIIALWTLSTVLYERGDTEEARRFRSTLVELDPDAGEARMLSDVAAVMGDAEFPPPDPEPEEELAVMDLGALAPDPEAPVEDLDRSEPVYTRTLGELYVRQGFVGQALNVFRKLLELEPEAEDIRGRIVALEGGAPSDEGGAESDEEVETLARDLAQSGEGEHDVRTPFAWAQEESAALEPDPEPDGPEIGAYFDSLLSWDPGEGS
jgi:tetratricopeptide (TPR) repeat protein